MIKKILFISNHASFFSLIDIIFSKKPKEEKLDLKLIVGTAASKTMDKIAITRFKVDKLDYSQYNYTHSKISIKNDLISLIKIKHVIDKNLHK